MAPQPVTKNENLSDLADRKTCYKSAEQLTLKKKKKKTQQQQTNGQAHNGSKRQIRRAFNRAIVEKILFLYWTTKRNKTKHKNILKNKTKKNKQQQSVYSREFYVYPVCQREAGTEGSIAFNTLGHVWCHGQHVCFPSLPPMLGATRGVMISTPAFLACHQC